jgi:hypothetical protein
MRSAEHLLAALWFLSTVAAAPPDDFGPESAPKADAAAKKPLAKPGDDREKADDDAPAKPAVPAKPAGPAQKILVLPYQAIYRSVPQKKLDDATNLLQKELAQLEGVAIVRGAVAAPSGAAASAPTLDGAHAAAQAADGAEANHDIKTALEQWRAAITAYRANAAALDDASELIFAQLYLARALMMAGQDKEAKEALEGAVRMNPSFELTREAFPRLFQKWFAEAAATAVKEPRGSIVVRSALPGATISLDGRPMDVAPVQIDDVLPGAHLISARIEGVPTFAQVVEVQPGKKTEVSASFSDTAGGSAVGRVTDAIAQNSVPKAAVESASTAGKEAGAAFVIFGGMSKEDDRFRVHTYLVDAKDSKVAALETISFDLEMLTAESDVLRIARAAQGMLASFPKGEASIASVESKIRVQSTVNKVSGAPEYAAAGTSKVASKKAGPRPVFKPLKGGKVTIKDEEGTD